MKELDAFVNVFGDITVLQVVEILLALGFLYFVYKKVSSFLIQQHEEQKLKDAQLKEALDGVHKYPEYRQQSIEIQQELNGEIKGLKISQEELRLNQEKIVEHLMQIEEQNRRRERNKLRDRLLQNYRHYTNKETNPSQSWSRMESEAFWELFRDYEDMGGNGYMKSEVMPAMQRLNVTEVGK